MDKAPAVPRAFDRFLDAGAARTRALAPTTWRNVAFWSAVALLPIGVAAVTSRRSRLAGVLAGGLTAIGLGALRYQLQRWFTIEPAFEVEQRLDGLEIRRYAPRVEARTEVPTDDHEQALEHGFEILAGYIFGGFRGSELGEHLEMLQPVVSQHAGHHHTVSFVMPEGRTADSLPEPDDTRIHVDEIPARRVAVLAFRGRYDSPAIEQHQQQLLERVRAAGFQVVGEPAFAGFDPPATLPWLRRNEVWVQIAD